MNNCTFIGRLANDPKINVGQNYKTARFALAIDRGKDKDGNDRGADFPTMVCFGKSADFAEKWLRKGRFVGIEAHVITGKYDKDGRTVYTTDFAVDRITMVDWPEKDGERPSEQTPEGFSRLTDDDIPF